MKCSVEDCDRQSRTKDMCSMHYKRFLRHGDTDSLTPTRDRPKAKCIVPDCSEPCNSKLGLCHMHYNRHSRFGRLDNVIDRGSGFSMNNDGYITIYINEKAAHEHVYKAEQALGKPLPKEAIVHHMNKKPWDNDTPFNLIVCPNQAYHMLLHKRMKEFGYGEDN